MGSHSLSLGTRPSLPGGCKQDCTHVRHASRTRSPLRDVGSQPAREAGQGPSLRRLGQGQGEEPQDCLSKDRVASDTSGRAFKGRCVSESARVAAHLALSTGRLQGWAGARSGHGQPSLFPGESQVWPCERWLPAASCGPAAWP